jgi:hypothetical protein
MAEMHAVCVQPLCCSLMTGDGVHRVTSAMPQRVQLAVPGVQHVCLSCHLGTSAQHQDRVDSHVSTLQPYFGQSVALLTLAANACL